MWEGGREKRGTKERKEERKTERERETKREKRIIIYKMSHGKKKNPDLADRQKAREDKTKIARRGVQREKKRKKKEGGQGKG